MPPRAIICPHCGKIIAGDESACSWCGTARSHPWWRLLKPTRDTARTDWVAPALLAANVVFFAVSLILNFVSHSGSILTPGNNVLLLLGASGTIPIDRYGRIWSLVSANYLHGGVLHLLFNMLALRQIGPWVVREFGASRMFVIYTVGGVFGYWVSYVAGVPLTVGASASLCGLIGALLYFGKNRGGNYGNAVYREVSGWVMSIFIFGIIVPGVNNWGHGGGLVGGIAMGMLLGYNEKRKETPVHRALALACGVITVAVLLRALYGVFPG
ncbi:rhomboid family intramembrane serine protease [Geomesophilobacter sediminis]|uniref:Rhomboid family intramembrane serine protease n=1 Tax=Geomesophilobacter sediminis TaxID=2798584 RepID=A0A8J7JC91_9BACT|nr:rhomboid family intramembrane serine protease [Geomesophilobacter sediminis]MBJ6724926.1 rhomboid family intramembrane serine protease [Geomesophilobacter sediminis]